MEKNKIYTSRLLGAQLCEHRRACVLGHAALVGSCTQWRSTFPLGLLYSANGRKWVDLICSHGLSLMQCQFKPVPERLSMWYRMETAVFSGGWSFLGFVSAAGSTHSKEDSQQPPATLKTLRRAAASFTARSFIIIVVYLFVFFKKLFLATISVRMSPLCVAVVIIQYYGCSVEGMSLQRWLLYHKAIEWLCGQCSILNWWGRGTGAWQMFPDI